MTRKGLIISLLAICLVILIGISSLFTLYYAQPGPLAKPTTVIIEPGWSLAEISQTLAQKEIISYPFLFSAHVRLRQNAAQLQAGEYQFALHVTPEDVVTALTQGLTVKHAFTVPEGVTLLKVFDALNSSDLFQEEITAPVSEGDLLPETYLFTRNESRNKMLKRMRKAMTQALDQLWSTRAPDFPLHSPKEALILASIVEKETRLAAERPRVAAVLLNRLKKGMKLQADPTVLYGLNLERKIPQQQLSTRDLEYDTPYNTYLHTGLPPTPICNPGFASLQAVVHPSPTNELFFVANGTGGHTFSQTYLQHKKHHQKWRIIRKQRSRS